MDAGVARWLVSHEAVRHIVRAGGFDDPSSLATGTALRRELDPQRAAAVLDLVDLRRRGGTKLGDLAGRLFLTHDGLQEATRWQVARWRAERIAAYQPNLVVDLGCGLGIDALACQNAGMPVTAVERDPVTAIFAAANLTSTVAGTSRTASTDTHGDGSFVSHVLGELGETKEPSLCLRQWDEPGVRTVAPATVITADVTALDLGPWLADRRTVIFLDPARRTARGRSWNPDDLSPSWDFVWSVIDQARGPVVVKLGPGFPHHLLPEGCDATWVSQHGDLVETTLWSGPGVTGQRQAVILGRDGDSRSVIPAGARPPAAGPLATYLYEPDPGVIRAQAVGTLAHQLGAWPVAPGIAYLTGPALLGTPFATAFEIESSLDFSVRNLRGWARDHQIGSIEIKVRGLDVDPAVLRRDLHLQGKHSATVVLTLTTEGTKALVVRRIRL